MSVGTGQSVIALILPTMHPKKWYFACSKYTLLEVGIQLMLTHQCKNLSDLESVDFQICLSIHSPAMEEHVIEISRCDFSHDLNRFLIHVERSRGITQPL